MYFINCTEPSTQPIKLTPEQKNYQARLKFFLTDYNTHKGYLQPYDERFKELSACFGGKVPDHIDITGNISEDLFKIETVASGESNQHRNNTDDSSDDDGMNDYLSKAAANRVKMEMKKVVTTNIEMRESLPQYSATKEAALRKVTVRFLLKSVLQILFR